MAIPASAIVNVQPGVITAGGSGLDLVGLFLTNGTRVPIGSVLAFSTAAAVSSYFGPLSTEAQLAATYFAGYDGSTIKPARALFYQYASAPTSAFLRGGALNLTLAQLQALSGVLTISVDGANKTSTNINLSSATSFSNAATLIQAAFTTPGFVVTYDAQSGAFLFTNTDTGTVSTIGFATGTLSAGLNLTAATGAVTSQGAAATDPTTAMNAVVALTQNFASFTTTFQPSTSDMLAFSAWASAQNQRYVYAAWEGTTPATATPDTSSFGYQLRQLAYAGTCNLYDPNNPAMLAAFVMGSLASINYARVNGRTTAAFRSASGLFAGVSNQQIAANLIANGYNFYGAYATANQPFNFFYPGQVSGQFAWLDTYTNEIWMNAGFQLALMTLLTTAGSIPYNADGYATVEAALNPQIEAAVAFGAIRGGITLSPSQIAQANAAAGRDISAPLQTRGWYAICIPATAAVRAARGPVVVYFFYCDGQSIQAITLNSILVQ